MCVNQETSLATFLLGTFCAGYIARRGTAETTTVATILVLVSLMQLIEFFMWRDQDCGTTNRLASLAAIVVLFLQPVVLLLVVIAIARKRQKPLSFGHRSAATLVVLALATSFGLIMYRALKLEKSQADALCSLKDPHSCRLQWSVLRILFENMAPVVIAVAFTAYFGGLLYDAYLSKYVLGISTEKILGWGVSLGVLATSLLYAFAYHRRQFYLIFGSVWCFLALFGGVAGVLYYEGTELGWWSAQDVQ